MCAMNQLTQTPLTDYSSHYREAEESFDPSLREMKKNAMTRFGELGFPTTRNEDWKYTSLAGLLNQNFIPSGKELRLTADAIRPFVSGLEKEIVLVFENGKFNPALSRLEYLPANIIAGDLRDHTNHPAVREYLGKIASFTEESFVALNTALFSRGAFIYADKNVAGDVSIHLLFINDARTGPVVCHPRNLYIASAGSSLKISENYYSVKSADASFCNPVTEIHIGENASLELCKNQSEQNSDFHIDYTGIVQQKNSNLNINTITTGGKLVRNNLRIALQGRNASARLNGLYVISGGEHVDNHSYIDHASPDCYSNELYKGILDDQSRGVFNGRIYVRKDAQKTNAFQSNKNILLSDDANINSKPQLEIYADDVKCTHGATTGQLDSEAMFYLRSRGIGEREAQALLTNAFAEEVLEKISITALREKLMDRIHTRLLKDQV
jgi:Fe-S cluster assembly protein SufD